MTETKLKRRWVRFSLRMLLATLTIFCFWLTREIGWHKDRQETLAFSRGIPKQIARHVIATMFEFGEAPQVAAQKREAFLAQSLDCRGVLAARMAADYQALQADELSRHSSGRIDRDAAKWGHDQHKRVVVPPTWHRYRFSTRRKCRELLSMLRIVNLL